MYCYPTRWRILGYACPPLSERRISIETETEWQRSRVWSIQRRDNCILAKALKRFGLDCKIYAFDTFSQFPPRKSLFDLYDDSQDEFSDFDSVSDYCKPFNIELVRGDICETYHRIESIPLVLSLFDTDNYSPTRAALDTVYRQTVSGGILAFDHYYCDEKWIYTVGERMAISEVLHDKDVLNFHGTGIFLKV